MQDPDGYWALALVQGSYMTLAEIVGASNIWNPIGWAVVGVVAVVTITVVVDEVIKSSKENKENVSDGRVTSPIGRRKNYNSKKSKRSCKNCRWWKGTD